MAEKQLGDAGPRGRALRWHRALALITGGLSLAIGRGLSRAKLREWAATLRGVATDMEETANGDEKTDA